MKINIKILIPYLIVIVPLALVLTASFFITTFYLEKVTTYFNSAKERSFKEHIDAKKAKSEMWSKQLNLLFDYKYSRVQHSVEEELKARVDIAYETSSYIYEKYKKSKSKSNIKERIVDALSHMKYGESQNYIFITDFSGNSVLLGNQAIDKKNLVSYLDSERRSIVIEEIQKVRKYGEGFLYSKSSVDEEQEIILVKSLGIYEWFIGSIMKVKEREKQVKDKLLDMVQSIPLENSDFIALYDNKKEIYLSSKIDKEFDADDLKSLSSSLSKPLGWSKNIVEGYYYYNTLYEPMNWHLIYGFDTTSMSVAEMQKQEALNKVLDTEFDFILKASATIVFFVVMLSLLLSRKINEIFKQYQGEVEKRGDELEILNKSLEQRVQSEIKHHRQKDKMLIQRSKMADMGDMLSMIAHQWRQPLNQLSYIFMNIESAYEYKELTKEYLDSKIKEGNEQLEFMSVTIDDFRNYFKPDKEKEFVLVSDVVQTSVDFMKQSLEMHAIEVELITDGRELTHLYKNEFIQVLLNLIKNAKDVLSAKDIKNPKMIISSICYREKLIVSVCDNGGGVKEEIIDKIFDPYFSTKDTKSGTGLGLYMSKMIIEEHLDGKLSVSNTQEGACFKIEL